MTSQTDSASILLNKVVNWDGKSPDINQVLTTAFKAKDYLDCIRDLKGRGIDPVPYINNLDKVCAHLISTHQAQFLTVLRQVVDSLPVDSELKRRCLRALRKTCGLQGILPDSYTITYSLSKPSGKPFSKGGFSDVWKVTDEKNEQVFVVKVLRVSEEDPVEKVNKVWSSLQM